MRKYLTESDRWLLINALTVAMVKTNDDLRTLKEAGHVKGRHPLLVDNVLQRAADLQAMCAALENAEQIMIALPEAASSALVAA